MNNFKTHNYTPRKNGLKFTSEPILIYLTVEKLGCPNFSLVRGISIWNTTSLKLMTVFAKPNFPFTGERASPALGAMQGLNPDLRMHAWKIAKHKT